jgi:hypothetical protein
MPRQKRDPNTDEKTTVVGIRMPTPLVAILKNGAQAENVSLSDFVRVRIQSEAVKPYAKPTPTRRPPRQKPASNSDPLLLRQLAAIGNNVNQIALAVNRSDERLTTARLLLALQQIERQLEAIADAH